jgi:hypothetical protein
MKMRRARHAFIGGKKKKKMSVIACLEITCAADDRRGGRDELKDDVD